MATTPSVDDRLAQLSDAVQQVLQRLDEIEALLAGADVAGEDEDGRGPVVPPVPLDGAQMSAAAADVLFGQWPRRQQR